MTNSQFYAVALLAATTTNAMAQSDTRSELGDQADVFEAVVSTAVPGARIDWDAAVLRRPDGTTDRIEMVCYADETWEGHRVSAVVLQYPDRIEDAVEKGRQGIHLAAGAHETLIGVVPRGPNGEVGEPRIGSLEPTGRFAQCTELDIWFDPRFAYPPYAEFVTPVVDYTAPFIQVGLLSLHEHNGKMASIVWGGVIESRSMEYRGLLPFAASLESPSVTEQFDVRGSALGELEFHGMFTGGRWRYRCEDPTACLVPPSVVLGWLSHR